LFRFLRNVKNRLDLGLGIPPLDDFEVSSIKKGLSVDDLRKPSLNLVILADESIS